MIFYILSHNADRVLNPVGVKPSSFIKNQIFVEAV